MHIPVPEPGTFVWIRARRWRVRRAHATGRCVTLDVDAGPRRRTFVLPFDRAAAARVRARPCRVRRQHAVARLAACVARTFDRRTLVSLAPADVEVLPFQLALALAILGGTRRGLVADEVGLGKTIQAGILIAELARRRASFRGLVVAPSALVGQWRAELAARFDLDAAVVDARMPESAAGAGLFIASVDYLKQPHVIERLPRRFWDLVVIDEAHDVCGDSRRHTACDELARRARAVVLLTATPHSGDEPRFQRLTRLGQLPDLDDPIVMLRRTRAGLGMSSTRRVRWRVVRLSREEHALLDALASYERSVLAAASSDRRSDAWLLLSVFRKRALSTARALERSIERRQSWLERADPVALPDWRQPRLMFDEEADDIDAGDAAGLCADVGVPVAAELSWMRRLRTLAAAAARRETKVSRLVSAIARTTEPVAIFTEFRHSLEIVALALSRVRCTVVMHGGQSGEERRAALRDFLNGRASVLVATDVAGQGLNLHTRARWVVSLELPWNPARLEQRIGRVDRLGQPRPVHASLLVARHPAEEGVLASLARRRLAARGAIGDDGLGTEMPGEVAAAIFANATNPEPGRARASLSATQRFERPARAAARQVLARRAYAGRFRGGHDIATRRPAWTRWAPRPIGRKPRLEPWPTDIPTVLVSVPILDRAGTELERHLVWLGVDAPLVQDALALTTSAPLLAVAATRLLRRAGRVAHAERSRVTRAIDVEAALVRHLQAGFDREGQPSLFDGRLVPSRDEARRAMSDAWRDLAERSGDLAATAETTVGRPSVVLLFLPAPWGNGQ